MWVDIIFFFFSQNAKQFLGHQQGAWEFNLIMTLYYLKIVSDSTDSVQSHSTVLPTSNASH